MTQKGKIDLFTDQFKQELIEGFAIVINCQKCSESWHYYNNLHNFTLTIRNVLRHLRDVHNMRDL